MKIGILTFHKSINHGAFFQAYTTYSFLKTKGYDVEIINYINKNFWFNDYKAFLWTKKPTLLYKNIIKIFKFKKSYTKFKLSKFTKNTEKLDTLKYDVIIVGSDIVWNYEWIFLGNDPIYFGEGIEAKKLISYAPSCGAVNIDNPIPDFVKKGLTKFAHISVRDEHTLKIVQKAIGVIPKIVLDPTFIYDTRGEEPEIKEEKQYVLVYAFSLREKEIQSTIKYAKENNCKLISVGYSNPWCDKNYIDIGPFEWLSYFKNAKYILTSTFHGTIFSINYEKNFVTSNNAGIETKIKTILETIGLGGRVIENQSVEELFDKGIDYMHISSKLNELIEDSRNYLLRSIND